MASKFIVGPSGIDPNTVTIPLEDIRKCNPQRYEMEHLQGILRFDPENGIVIGYKDQAEDEFWVKGHIPGRPLMPGVIMIETAAQLCSFYYKWMNRDDDRFIGFGGVDGVKFRGTVAPGDKFIIVGKCLEMRSRRMIFDTQGVVDGKLVFEGKIIGMPV